MTVRVRRSLEVEASPADVWAFVADPAERAAAISVVERYEEHDDGTTTWHVRLPIPLLSATARVETREVEREPPHRVTFEGRSRLFEVRGTHVIEETATGCRLDNEFVVEGRVPGVERYFRRHLDEELGRLERALRSRLGLAA